MFPQTIKLTKLQWPSEAESLDSHEFKPGAAKLIFRFAPLAVGWCGPSQCRFVDQDCYSYGLLNNARRRAPAGAMKCCSAAVERHQCSMSEASAQWLGMTSTICLHTRKPRPQSSRNKGLGLGP